MKEKKIGLYQCPDCKRVFVSYKIEASGTYGQNIIAEVMDDGIIFYRIKEK